ncbi:MAG TPA: phytanoyl-CoA dioxygenase family protein [Myxococcota bacterium]
MLPAWDFARRRVGVDALAAAVLAFAQAEAPGVRSLERLHEHLDAEAARALADRFTAESWRPRLRALLHDVVRALVGADATPSLVVQWVGVLRVLVPGDARAALPLHADMALGHAPDERNLWVALTDALDSAALHALDLAPSRAVLARNAGPFYVDDTEAVASARPRNCRRGHALLFTPLHVHGGSVNRGLTTRVSVDIRVAPTARAGERKRTGAVFVPLVTP